MITKESISEVIALVDFVTFGTTANHFKSAKYFFFKQGILIAEFIRTKLKYNMGID